MEVTALISSEMGFTQLAACFAQLLMLEHYWFCVPELSGEQVLKNGSGKYRNKEKAASTSNMIQSPENQVAHEIH